MKYIVVKEANHAFMPREYLAFGMFTNKTTGESVERFDWTTFAENAYIFTHSRAATKKAKSFGGLVKTTSFLQFKDGPKPAAQPEF